MDGNHPYISSGTWSLLGVKTPKPLTDGGKKRAVVAVAHSMLIAIYHMLSKGIDFHDLGSGYYNQFNKGRKANSLMKKLKELGFEVTVATPVLTA